MGHPEGTVVLANGGPWLWLFIWFEWSRRAAARRDNQRSIHKLVDADSKRWWLDVFEPVLNVLSKLSFSRDSAGCVSSWRSGRLPGDFLHQSRAGFRSALTSNVAALTVGGGDAYRKL